MADLPVAAQPAPVQKDPQTGNQRAPFGTLKGTWKVLRSSVLANESAPTEHLELINETVHERMRFAVVIPAAVAITGYRVHVGRWINAGGKGVTVNQWVEEYTDNKTVSHVFDIEIGRDPVGIFVDNIAGVIGTGFHILYQPTNRVPTK